MPKRTKKISEVFQKWLSVIVVLAFVLSLGFSWALLTRMSRMNATKLLRINIEDVRQDVIDASDKNLLELTQTIAAELDGLGQTPTSEMLGGLLEKYDVAEINVIDPDGIIVASTYPFFLNYDMRNGEQSAEFMGILGGDLTSYVQSYQPTSHDSSLSRKYAGVLLKNGGFVQVGYDADRFQRDIDAIVVGVTRNRHVGENGFVIVANKDWLIVSDRNQNEGQNLYVSGIWIDRDTMPEQKVFTSEVYGQSCFCMYTVSEGYYIVSVIPRDEVVLSRDTSVLMTAAMEIMVFLAMFVLIFILVRKLVVNNIDSVNGSLAQITDGDLDVVVDVRDSVEFSSLSDDINTTVSTLKRYIADASARIDQELEFARVIQLSAMPRVFPGRPDFEVCASIDPAREVGGDFYDFFLVDEDHAAMVIADVSGKGIPAAMFMMTSKTLIKNRALLGENPEAILKHVNRQLCEGNEAELFVTVWLAILELSTGKGLAANAGHEHPALRRRDGEYELLKYRHSPAVALEEDVRFREHSFELHPGDSLFVYTDGIPEAHNEENKLYGTERMLDALNHDPNAAPETLLNTVRKDIETFQGNAAQFDDVTMIAFRYWGTEPHTEELPEKELTVEAAMENLPQVMALVDCGLDGLACSPQVRRQVKIALEELYVNVVSYAYAPDTGPVTVRVATEKEPPAILITLIDSGIPYDPLKKPDPDLSLSPEERPIGGMGIYMVKKSMDAVTYQRVNDQNVLTLRKMV